MERERVDENTESWLQETLESFSCQTGTIHRSYDGETLELIASIGVPGELMPMISLIPFGKGIAGAAAASRKPVELCNLQKDLGGVAKEGARKTKVAGSLAVPVFSKNQSRVIGTLGIGMREPHDFTEDEKRDLGERAEFLARQWEGV